MALCRACDAACKAKHAAAVANNPCTAVVKCGCKAANKNSCAFGSSACGKCFGDFKNSGGHCVAEACNAKAKIACIKEHKSACSSGSATCGTKYASFRH